MNALWAALRHEWRLLLVAVQFLTRIPVNARALGGAWDPAWLQACLRHFPWVGAIVGTWAAAVTWLAAQWWPPAVAVLLGMAATVWLTGGFHEDGWADTCDGLGGAVDRQKALTIMKDSRLGTYGALGLILLLATKAAILIEMASPRITELNPSSEIQRVLLLWTGVGLVWCHAASRAVPVWLTGMLPYAGDEAHAKAKPLALQVSRMQVVLTLLSVLGVALIIWAVFRWSGWPLGTLGQAMGRSAVVMALVAWVCGRWFRRRLGGFTGDTLGASQQLAEVAGLLAWLSVIHPVG
ncbi:adenosylcobinamide-GDP ribazoletransferase [Aquabacterium fontiphilum]|uniref:adenosylcobinamide-GDP ribazoletransferase n=1 Tax=Aquabacterium fontiphilum TaxID=450365 RepID=UPI00191BF90A|nr:adenosylcobinamide-GDP ribazoletransferase [Aquabacterium fontiphilum]